MRQGWLVNSSEPLRVFTLFVFPVSRNREGGQGQSKARWIQAGKQSATAGARGPLPQRARFLGGLFLNEPFPPSRPQLPLPIRRAVPLALTSGSGWAAGVFSPERIAGPLWVGALLIVGGVALAATRADRLLAKKRFQGTGPVAPPAAFHARNPPSTSVKLVNPDCTSVSVASRLIFPLRQ